MIETPVRTRNPEQTVERLTEAALSLFSRNGYDRTSIDSIVSAAGLSKGAFYNHFASKEEFLLYLLERRLKANLTRIQGLYGKMEHPATWLRSLLESLLTTAKRDGQWAVLSIEFMVQAMRDERLASRMALLHDEWRRLIAEQLRRHAAPNQGRPTADPETIAAAVVALIDGLIIHAALEPELMTRMRIDKLVEQLVGSTEESSWE